MKKRGIQVTDSDDQGNYLDLKVEITRNADGKITQGLIIGDTLQQNIAFVLMAEKGEFKAVPELGVGFGGILLDNDFIAYQHKIRNQFPIDGLKVKRLDLFQNKPVIIQADYE